MTNLSNEHKGRLPAFPFVVLQGQCVETGLSKREWLAGMAMQGLASRDIRVGDGEPATLAERAVSYADALLSALKETP